MTFGVTVETQLDARNGPAELRGINDIVAALTPVFDPQSFDVLSSARFSIVMFLHMCDHTNHIAFVQ